VCNRSLTVAARRIGHDNIIKDRDLKIRREIDRGECSRLVLVEIEKRRSANRLRRALGSSQEPRP
jgi:hypothetical protein